VYDPVKKHQLLTAGPYTMTYDANGNVATMNGATSTWTSFNLPATMVNGTKNSAFSYTPDRSYWKQVATYSGGITETTLYLGGLLEKVTRGATTEYRHYVATPGAVSVLHDRRSDGINATYSMAGDHLGSTSIVTDAAQALVVNESFGAFGMRRSSNWQGAPSAGDLAVINDLTRVGFTGHTMLDNLFLVHMNGRIYAPGVGRMISADPYIPDPGNTQAFNRYSYVYNNPLSYTDPSGFTPIGDAAAVSVCGPEGALLCSAIVSTIVDEVAVKGIKKLLDVIGDLLGDLFGGLFGGGGRPFKPTVAGCYSTNPVACTGVRGVNSTPGFNPVMGLAGVTGAGGDIGIDRRPAARSYLERVLGAIAARNRNGWASPDEVALAVREHIRRATNMSRYEASVSFYFNPATGRYGIDLRTIGTGDGRECLPGAQCGASTIPATAGDIRNATTIGHEWAGEIHGHPTDSDFHDADLGNAAFHAKGTDAASGSGYKSYIVTSSGKLCSATMVRGEDGDSERRGPIRTVYVPPTKGRTPRPTPRCGSK
jgi:RHS repeat-associated protein